ncbi:MAG: homocysteine S-methyltransferase [Succinivibrio sp.]|nr:homocysteine S-methyltransferase [Succinivibrio sp.]
MQPAEDFLRNRKFMVLDGAFATELERLGLNLNDPLWSALALIDKDELIKQVHTAYLKAGADIITTSSYQASVRGFMTKCLTQAQAEALIIKSVKLAQEARDRFVLSEEFKKSGRRKPLVAASLGPYGAYLADGSEYRGGYQLSAAELKDFHAERIAILAKAAPDLFALETVPQLSEAQAVAEILRQQAPSVPLWIAFACRNDTCIADGTKLSACARALNAYDNIFALGVNCTLPQYIENLVRELKASTDKLIIVYPNSGERYDPETKTWHGNSDEFSSNILAWASAGAKIIGGCCRTTPELIAKLEVLSHQK